MRIANLQNASVSLIIGHLGLGSEGNYWLEIPLNWLWLSPPSGLNEESIL